MTDPQISTPSTAQDVEPPGSPPAKVAALAAEHGMGRLLASRKGSNPVANFGFGLLAAAVLFGVALLVDWLATLTEIRLLAFFSVLLIVGSVMAVVFSVIALFAGFTGSFIYERGIVQTKNGRSQAARWSDVDQMMLWRTGGQGILSGRIVAYYLRTFDGRKIPVEAKFDNDLDSYGDLLPAPRYEGRDLLALGCRRP